ncbi:MAG: tetratricopeptide repeat protein [Chloroflexi bacterium]|uniref:Tetratricopeptide repeat protein n=1 Tax=Candidatus Chlorohelix allophototropha TaxID=3003348 RepID=A0A8T7M5X6_9CHLR|nr:tetratricopeptide repeat protein [Chloroflexota bacterium]WJW69415.1 tetratricopeptide repeat protein [Chloroflexota bacterium L227-S17]
MTDSSASGDEFNLDDFNLLSSILQSKFGLYFDTSKFPTLKSAVKERFKEIKPKNIAAYIELIAAAEASYSFPIDSEIRTFGESKQALNSATRESHCLVELLTVNETKFFRNKEHFRAIREKVLPELIESRASEKKLRIWSSGCSTGQEPYSIAMLVTEAITEIQNRKGTKENWEVQIIASDISEKALNIAAEGRYRNDDISQIERTLVDKYFFAPTHERVATAPLELEQFSGYGRAPHARGKSRATYLIKPEIKAAVTFYYFNLASDNYPVDLFSNFDLVICENVTIYFSQEITRRVIDNIYRAMNEASYLFIGYSETLWQISDKFKLINNFDTFYYRKPTALEDQAQTLKYSSRITAPLPPDIAKTSAAQSTKPPPRVDTAPLQTGQPIAATPPPLSFGADSNWQALLKDGLTRMAKHEFTEAGRYLEKAVYYSNGNLESLIALARLKAKISNYTEAEELCRRAISADPLCEEAHLILGLIMYRKGNLAESIFEFQQVIYIDIESVPAHMYLGDIYRNAGQTAAAIREYRHALSALRKYASEDMIEDLPVSILKQSCEQNLSVLNRA